MSSSLTAFYGDLNLDGLRIKRPSKFVFLCGGTIASAATPRPVSLRDYLFRVRKLPSRLNGEIVLAETATQLYRDTSYGDLISFEEDIARIASIVLLIAESPGSFAELGAFSANDTIRKALRIVIQESFASIESFIRYGPVERIRKDNREFVGFYPWRLNGAGRIILRSAAPHYREITQFINQHIKKIPSSELYVRSSPGIQDFYIIYWIIYLCLAVSFTVLVDLTRDLIPHVSWQEISNKLYCMQLAGWIKKVSYSGKDYFYVLFDEDPFEYSFKPNVANHDSVRRKADFAVSLSGIERPPRHVRQVAVENRRPKK